MADCRAQEPPPGRIRALKGAPPCLSCRVQKPVDPCVWLALVAAPLVIERCLQEQGRHSRRQQLSGSRGGQEQAQGDAERREAAGNSSIGGSSSDGSDSDSSDSSDRSDSDSGYGSSSNTETLESSRSSGADLAGGEQLGGEQQAHALRLSEQQRRQQYLERYGQVVSDVFDAMLQVMPRWGLAGGPHT